MADQTSYQNLGIGLRVARFLRRTYPRDRAKLIARRFDVSVPTANRWLAGYAPTTAHLEEMIAEWGLAFLEAVFTEAYVERDERIRHLEAELERLRSALAAERVAAHGLAELRQPEFAAVSPSSRHASDAIPPSPSTERQLDGAGGGRPRSIGEHVGLGRIDDAQLRSPTSVTLTRVSLDAHARRSMTRPLESLSSEVPIPNALRRLLARWI